MWFGEGYLHEFLLTMFTIFKMPILWASLGENLSSGFLKKGDSNQSPQLPRLARKLKFHL